MDENASKLVLIPTGVGTVIEVCVYVCADLSHCCDFYYKLVSVLESNKSFQDHHNLARLFTKNQCKNHPLMMSFHLPLPLMMSLTSPSP